MRLLLPTAVLALSPAALAGTTHDVCASCTHDSIQAAIDDASTGDVILVHPGTWSEDLTLDETLTLQSTAGSADTTIEGGLVHNAIRVQPGVSASIIGFTVEPGPHRRAVDVGAGAQLSVDDLVVEDHSASIAVLGLDLGAGAEVDLLGSRFASLTAEGARGGAIQVGLGAVLDVWDTEFAYNTAGEGGAIYALDGTVSVERCAFTGNEAVEGLLGGRGGAIAGAGATLSITASTFDSNTAEAVGGHVYVLGDELDLIDSTLGAGIAGEDGGGVYATATSIRVKDTDWDENSALAGSGGHLDASGGSVVITGGELKDGACWESGGAVHVTHASLELRQVELVKNTSGGSGGAVSWSAEDGSLEIVECALTDNAALNIGGAVVAEWGQVVVKASAFGANQAGWGGALSLWTPDRSIVAASRFCGNTASWGEGGGAEVLYAEARTSVHNNVFVDCEAAEGGGALFALESQVDVVNNSFLYSDAGEGGGAARLERSTFDFRNNLVAWTKAGDGVHVVSDGTTGGSVDWNGWYANAVVHLSGDQGPGDGNQYGDPMLSPRAAAADCASLTPSPTVGSPLVDAGDPALSDPDGTRSDIGAFGGEHAEASLFADQDDDGWIAMFDCNEELAEVHPEADERCNDRDDDCDGVRDEDPVDGSPWYRDGDGDGFGDPLVKKIACAQLEGWVADDRDCDDTDAEVHPDAKETWYDGVDGDCDGWSDYDQDRDEHDSEDHGGGDCDDLDDAIHPGAEDLLNDRIDQDCDGFEDMSWVAGSGGCATGGGGRGWWVVGLVVAVRRRPRR